jgi:hypothetical protein
MWDWKVWKELLSDILREFRFLVQHEVERFTFELENWVNHLISKPLPLDWRKQTARFLLDWEAQGYRLTPRSMVILEWWIEAWAKKRGFWPPREAAAATEDRKTWTTMETIVVGPTDADLPAAKRVGSLNETQRPKPAQNRPAVKAPAASAVTEKAGYNANQAAAGAAKSLGVQLRDLYLKRAAAGALIAPQLWTGVWEWITNYHFSFQDDGSVENADKSDRARHAFMIEKAVLARVPTDGTWTRVSVSNENIYKTISWKEYRMFIREAPNTPDYNQASFWLGGTTDFRGHGSFEISLRREGRFATASFRNIQMVWAWVDEVDARSALEYDWFEDNFWQGLLEVSLGDIAGDKIVNGNYWAVIGFTETGTAGPFRFDLATGQIRLIIQRPETN